MGYGAPAGASGRGLPNPWEAGSDHAHRGNPLPGLLELRRARRACARSPRRSEYFQALGTLESFAGRYRDAQAAFDELEGAAIAGRLPAEAPAAAEAVPAAAAIVREAGRRRAVFINEAHHVPRHRAFTLSLLPALRRSGFTHFAAETLSEDEALMSRGYPLAAGSGYYAREPVFGELLRSAVRLGFIIVRYECTGRPGRRGAGGRWRDQNLRELGQAANLRDRVFGSSRRPRLLVHAGYGHIYKAPRDGWSPMAYHFRRLTGVDPFCVDQAALAEASRPGWDNPWRRGALGRWRLREPALLALRAGGWWVPPHLAGRCDAAVLHPPAAYRRGRPGWALLGGLREPRAIPAALRSAPRPCLVQAFRAGEPDGAVPCDQVLLEPGRAAPALALPRVRCLLRALGPDGHVLAFRLTSPFPRAAGRTCRAPLP